jgi:dTDP-glucose 4,6-dehydratase
MDWKKKTVLVTGAGGFIGSHLTEKLAELGATVRALVRYNSAGGRGWLDQSPIRDQIEVIAGDIRDPDGLRQSIQGVDTVFHLAALIAIPYSYESPISYIRTNVEGTTNLLQLARDAGVGCFVHTSTSEVYGTARAVPISEDHPLQGQSPYSASKIGADKIAEAFCRSYKLPVVTVRPFNTYGPRQSARAVIPSIITQAMSRPEVRMGHLHPTRDFTFVVDTVDGFIRAAESPKAIGQVIHLGTGEEISIGDLADMIVKLVGNKVPVVTEKKRERPEQSEVERLVADPKKALEILGWRPKHDLKSGLSKTIEWIRANADRYRPDEYVL